jgi:periplasmic protein TonB
MKHLLLKYGLCLLLLLYAGFSFSQEKKAPSEVYTIAEQMPSFPGGKGALSKYISKHLRYPESAMKNAVHGKVVVRFIVAADGSIAHPEILSSLDADCDKEALRVVSEIPKWDPGMQNGNFVAVYYNLPITFAMF